MGQRLVVAQTNSGGLVNSFEIYQGRIWAASGDYLCQLSEDTTTWEREILSPVPLKLLITYNNKLYMTSTDVNDSALYMFDDDSGNIVQVTSGIDSRAGNAKSLYILSDGGVPRLYAVYSNRSMVTRLNGSVWEVLIDYDAVAYTSWCKCSCVFKNNIYLMDDNDTLYKLNNLRNGWTQVITLYPVYVDSDDSVIAVHDDRLYICDYWGELFVLLEDESNWYAYGVEPSNYHYPKNLISYAGHLFLVTGNDYEEDDTSTELYIFNGSEFVVSWYYGPRGLRSSIIYNNKLYYASNRPWFGFINKYQSISSISVSPDVSSGEEPLSVNLSISYDSDFPVVGYNWDFNDSSPHEFTENVTHEYIVGTYSPTVIINNGVDQLSNTDDYPLYYRSMIDVYIPSQTYQISTITDLQKIGTPGNKPLGIRGYPLHSNYELINDIDASETVSWNGGRGFDPLSKESYYNLFSGILEGNNHTISNLYINNPTQEYTAIFETTLPCIIRNLIIENANVTGGGNTAVLVGYIRPMSWSMDSPTTIENCSIIGGSVTGISYVGGFAVYAYSTVFRNCTSSVNFLVNLVDTLGGIVAYLSFGILDTCTYENNTIQDLDTPDSSYTGGLVGYANLEDPGSVSYIRDCTVNAQFITRGRAGLLVGQTNRGTISNCAVHGYITVMMGGSRDHSTGTLIGECYSSNLENCHSDATIELPQDMYIEYIGGFIGFYMGWGSCKDCTVTTDILVGSGQNSDYIGGFVGYSNTVSYENCHATGDVRAYSYTGGFFGYHSGGEFINCSAQGNIEASGVYIGGFGGQADVQYSIVRNSYATGNVTVNNASRVIGGFIGYLYSNSGFSDYIIRDCYATGDLNIVITGGSPADYIGGLCGYFSGDLNSCYATGSITCSGPGTTMYVGGLCGEIYSYEVSRCYATGNVKSLGDYTGGLSGKLTVSYLSICYASGSVEGYTYTGGFIGFHDKGGIRDCYASGDVNSLGLYLPNSTGGFIGITDGTTDGIIERVYSSGDVSALIGNIGGLIGSSTGTIQISDSYWDIETSGVIISAGGTGKNTAAMKSFSNYIDWDFINIWVILDGEIYPLFEYPLPPPIPLHVQFIGNPLTGGTPLAVTFTDQSVW